MKKLYSLILVLILTLVGVNHMNIGTNTNKEIYENSQEKIDKTTKRNNDVQELDTTLVDTYRPSSYVLSQFTTATFINSIDELKKYSVVVAKPANVILRVDENMMLVNDKYESLSVELKDAYTTYIKGKMIPLIYISNENIADAFIDYYPANMNILDMAVISNDASIVKKVREVNTVIRGIIDYSDNTITKEYWYNIVKEANQSFANTIILNSNDATEDAITYIQARLKTVWVNNDSITTLKALEQINNGAYGIIANNPDNIYLATNAFRKTDNVLRNLTRKPFNIAHRGLITNYENSLEGCIEAVEKGATHVEIDIQVTKDNKLALMHDATIERTTTGTGAISDYTAEELKQFKIDSSPEGILEGEGVDIPLLDDILEYICDKETVLVIEIKTYNTNVVSLMRDCLEKYDAFANVIAISFYPAQLESMKTTLSEVPVASLGSVSYLDLATGLQNLSTENVSVNTTSDNSYSGLNRYLAARGYATWHWTYANINDVQKAIISGAQGLTNDCAEKFNNFAYKLYTDEEYIVVDNSFTDVSVELKCKTYGGNSDVTLNAKPIYVEEHGDFAYAIFSASFENTNEGTTYDFCIFSNPIKLVKK